MTPKEEGLGASGGYFRAVGARNFPLLGAWERFYDPMYGAGPDTDGPKVNKWSGHQVPPPGSGLHMYCPGS